MRVVSLLPSATETIMALGARDTLVGVSHSCDHPEVGHLPRLTRTRVPRGASSAEIDAVVRQCLAGGESLYTIDVETLDALEPDLIITQGLCDVCAVTGREVHDALCAVRTAPRVLSSEPHTLVGVLEAISDIGAALDRAAAAAELVAELRLRIERVRARAAAIERPPRVAFLEWLDPPMCGGHWNPELVELAGGVDGIGHAGEPSRTITWDDVQAWQPEVLCVACCGYPLEQTTRELAAMLRRRELSGLPFARTGRIHAFDGVGLFARPGPRIVDSLETLADAIVSGRSGRPAPEAPDTSPRPSPGRPT
jgi:iron complex transport system substrate-binding protein